MSHFVSIHPLSEVRIASGDTTLLGNLAVPDDARGLVLFADAGGRHHARCRQVAMELQHAGLATLLLDLLTPEEAAAGQPSRDHLLDLPLLTRRLEYATAWVAEQDDLRQLPLGYVGSGLGSAAALIAAARLGRQISAIALLGGRPDLAGPAVLAAVKASTLLVLGSKASGGIDLNTQAYQHLQGERSLAAVGGAGHLFDEAGAVAQAAEMAAGWFGAHMLEAETA